MPISIQADSTLPQGYILVDGVPCTTIAATGLSATNIITQQGSVDSRLSTLSSVGAALSSTALRRSFNDMSGGLSGRFIYIDSLLGNDTTADGSQARPFQTILSAVNYWSSFVETRGRGVVFKLAGDTTTPRTYKGCSLYIHGGRHAMVGFTPRDVPTSTIGTGDPVMTNDKDRVIIFQGNLQNPETVIVEPIFYRNRGEPSGGVDRNFYWGHCFRVEAPGQLVIVEGMTLRYNAVGRLPNYSGSDPLYNDTVDYFASLDFIACHLASVGRCILTGCYNSDTEASPGYSATTTQAAKYMLGLAFYNCTYPRLRSLIVTGSMRYIVKVSGGVGSNDGLRFDFPGTIELRNSPRFLSLFEVEYGAGLLVDWYTNNPNWVYIPAGDSNYPVWPGPYTLSFVNPTTTGACGSVRAGTSWVNYTLTNYDSLFASGMPWILFPSSTSNPAFTWPNNVTRRTLVHYPNPGTTMYRYQMSGGGIPANNTALTV